MNLGIESIVSNLGISFPDILLIIMLVAGLIFFAKDFKLGILMYFIMSGMLTMWFYAQGWDYSKVIVIFFMSLIAMSLTILFTAKATQTTGGFI